MYVYLCVRVRMRLCVYERKSARARAVTRYTAPHALGKTARFSEMRLRLSCCAAQAAWRIGDEQIHILFVKHLFFHGKRANALPGHKKPALLERLKPIHSPQAFTT